MLKALIVEDISKEAEALKTFLEEDAPRVSFLRFDRVDTAYACDVAVEKAKKTDYDVILFDFRLPRSAGEKPSVENGRWLVQEIGHLQRFACSILFSAFSAHEYALEVEKLGAVRRRVQKPASFERVLAAVEEAILEAGGRTLERLSARYHQEARVHEAMNSLNNILAAASEIERTCSPAGEFIPSRSLPLIREEVENIRRFQGAAEASLRDSNPADAGRREPCDLRQIAEWSVTFLQSQYSKRERITLRSEGGVPATFGVREELQQLILLLARNALQATAESGHVTVSLGVESKESRDIVLTVEDDGPGIPPAIRERIFQRDFTTRPGGSGQGLFLARAFVWNHGGSIQVESGEGEGTRVTVRLPVREVPAGA